MSQLENMALCSKSLPENAEAYLGKALAGSKKRLNKAFKKLKPLGPDSEFHKHCISHLRRLQRYQMPADDELWSKYRDAMRIAWWACWRSFDFSVAALSERYGERRVINLRSSGVSQHSDGYGSEWFDGMVPLVDCDGQPKGGGTTFRRFQSIADALNIFFKGELAGLIFRDAQQLADLPHFVGKPLSWCLFDAGLSVNHETPLKMNNCLALGPVDLASRRRTDTILADSYFESLSIESADKAKLQITDCLFGTRLSIGQFSPGADADFASNAVRGALVADRWAMAGKRARLPQMMSGSFSTVEPTDTKFSFQLSPEFSVLIDKATACKFEFPEGAEISQLSASGERITVDLPRTHVNGSISVSFTRSPSGQTLSLKHSKIEGDIKVSGPAESIVIVNSSIEGQTEILADQSAGDLLRLDGCIFSSDLICGSRCWRQVSFQNATVCGSTGFNNVLATQVSSFNQSRFCGDASFDLSVHLFGERTKSGPVDFREVVFEKDAHFRGRKFDAAANFDRTVWKGVPDFHLAELHPDTSFVSAHFDRPSLSRRRKAAGKDKAVQDYVMGRYQRAFQSLKLKAEGLRARGVEALFHRLEMVARREAPSTPLDEKMFSYLYDWMAKYGESFFRPLTGWIVQVFIFAIVLWGIRLPEGAEISERNSASFADGLLLSFNNSIRPFYATGASFDRMTAMEFQTNWPMNDYWWFVQQAFVDHPYLFRGVLVFQNILGVVFLFLFLLALRRRFQISG